MILGIFTHILHSSTHFTSPSISLILLLSLSPRIIDEPLHLPEEIRCSESLRSLLMGILEKVRRRGVATEAADHASDMTIAAACSSPIS